MSMSALTIPPCNQSELSSRRNSSRNGIAISTRPSSQRTSFKPKKRWYGDSERSGWFMLKFLLEFPREFCKLRTVHLACPAEWHGLKEIDLARVGIWCAVFQVELLDFLR